MLKNLNDKKATYETAHKFSVATGSTLADILSINLTPQALEVDDLYWTTVQKVLLETIQENHDVVSEYAQQVQAILNERASVNLKVQSVDFDSETIEKLANKLTSTTDFEKVAFVLKEPVISHSMRVVDRTLEKNADFQNTAGLYPKIRRTLGGKCCDWCNSLVGDYDYNKHINPDVFRRHDRCRCTVEYIPIGLKSKREIIHKGDGSMTKKRR